MMRVPYLTVEVVKRSCVFIVGVQNPMTAMAALCAFLAERKIKVEWMQLVQTGETARVTFLCQVEKDRIQRTVSLLAKMTDVMTLEWMEAKGQYEG